jgi:hypothetical protein
VTCNQRFIIIIVIIIIIIIIIIMKSSIGRNNNYCHYVILRSAGFAITLNYHPAGCVVIKVVYYSPYGWIVVLEVEVCDLRQGVVGLPPGIVASIEL